MEQKESPALLTQPGMNSLSVREAIGWLLPSSFSTQPNLFPIGFLLPLLLAFLSIPFPSLASDKDLVLKFQSGLIGKSENQQDYKDPDQFIDSYYALLTRKDIERVQKQRKALDPLIPKYKVAYTAADSAELAELMDKISAHWGQLSRLHESLFSEEVSKLLDTAYDEVMKQAMGDPN
ncbi:MAG: hypothetical protein AB8B95_03140 [Pseudohongiellaceae bacterium]